MKFIELTGKSLLEIVDSDELQVRDLARAGITAETIVRINQQGDIEVRRPDRWDLIGGLLGDFAQRIQSRVGMDWV